MTIEIPYIYVMLIIILAIIISVFSMLTISKKIGQWGIFAKAGVAEWKSLVPIYNQIQLLKICKLSPWFVVLYLDFIVPIVGFLLGRDITWITIIMLIGLLSYRFMITVRLGFCYKKGALFSFFAALFPSIFYSILGCSKDSEYTELKLKKEQTKEE